MVFRDYPLFAMISNRFCSSEIHLTQELRHSNFLFAETRLDNETFDYQQHLFGYDNLMTCDFIQYHHRLCSLVHSYFYSLDLNDLLLIHHYLRSFRYRIFQWEMKNNVFLSIFYLKHLYHLYHHLAQLASNG